MQSDDLYYWVRIINFTWAFGLFWLMVWGFILDRVVSRHCSKTHIPPEMHLWMIAAFCSVIATMWGTSELLLDSNAGGGSRVFSPIPALLFASLATGEALFRVKMHRLAIETGACGEH